MKKKHKILIVDDLDINRELLKILCENEGYATIEAHNGQEGVKLARQQSPDVILMDVMMPVLNGYEATAQIKQCSQTANIPVIMVTSLNEREERLKGIEMGANDFLTKPVDIRELSLRLNNNLKVVKYQYLLRNYNEKLQQEVHAKTQELRTALKNIDFAYKEAIEKLSLAAEFKDPETGAHIQRVSLYVKSLGQELGLDSHYVEDLYHAAPMHDIGKVGIPDRVLLKKGNLNEQEWQIMKSHTEIGEQILKKSSSRVLNLAAEIALTHHEKWDGSGYPRGLQAEEIPISGRIMAIADVYDALRSKRAYKPSISHQETFRIITAGETRTSPSHFAPEILDSFKRISDVFLDIYENHSE